MSDIIEGEDGNPVPAGVRVLHNNLYTALNKAYPKWTGSWLITIDTRGGVVMIRNQLISGKMGFYMHIAKIDSEMRNVVRHAGELFERYYVARDKGVEVSTAVNDMKRKFSGEAVHDNG